MDESGFDFDRHLFACAWHLLTNESTGPTRIRGRRRLAKTVAQQLDHGAGWRDGGGQEQSYLGPAAPVFERKEYPWLGKKSILVWPLGPSGAEIGWPGHPAKFGGGPGKRLGRAGS